MRDLKRVPPDQLTLGEARFVVDELRNRMAYLDELVDSLKRRNQYDVADAKKAVLMVIDEIKSKVYDMKIRGFEAGEKNPSLPVYEEVLEMLVRGLDPS